MELIGASTPAHYEQVRELLVEYIAWDSAGVMELGLDGALVQQFYYGPGALSLPGKYAPPEGFLLLAQSAGKPAGCGAFSRQSDGVCELHRVYVRREYRGQKLGQRIVLALMDHARTAGYRLMRLETVSFMKSAIAMYREMGFEECGPYYEIPQAFREITIFMEREL